MQAAAFIFSTVFFTGGQGLIFTAFFSPMISSWLQTTPTPGHYHPDCPRKWASEPRTSAARQCSSLQQMEWVASTYPSWTNNVNWDLTQEQDSLCQLAMFPTRFCSIHWPWHQRQASMSVSCSAGGCHVQLSLDMPIMIHLDGPDICQKLMELSFCNIN